MLNLRGGDMKTRRLGTGLLGAALALAVLPSGAIADTMDAACW
jgi:hypothetical protein